MNATNLTFNAGDVLVGGAGTDTLSIINTGAGVYTPPSATVSGFENIDVRNLSGSTAVTAVTGVTAQAQVTTITAKFAAANSDTIVVNYGGLTQTVTLTGVTNQAGAATNAGIITAAINGMAGATIAAVGTTATTNDHIITVTAPVAGVALPTIAFSSATNTADYPTVAATTPNIVAVTAVTGVAATTPSTMTVDATKFTDATTFKTDGSTGLVDFTGLTAAQTANMNAGSGGMGAGFGATVTAGTVNISGGTTAGNVAITGAALTTMTINSTGAANTIGTLTGATSTTATTINAATALTTGAATNLGATVTITGAGNVSFGTTALEAGVTTLNASAMTGGLTAVLGTAVTQTVTGGAGADVITTGAVLTTGSVNAGAGTDRLIVADSTHLASATLGAKYTNFEVLQVNNAVSVDLDNIAGITAIRINDGAGATAVSDLTAVQAAAVTMIAGNGATTIGVKNAATVGQIDTVKITYNDGDTTLNEAFGAASNLTLSGVENLEVTAVDQATIVQAAATSGSLTSVKLFGAGNHSFTTGDMATANFTLDASGSTGTNILSAATFATNGVAITGGSGADTITGSGQADVINGGLGGDTITGGLGIDTVNLGADSVANTVVLNDDTAGNQSVVTNFKVANDIISFDESAFASINFGGTAAVAALDATDYNEIAAAGTLIVDHVNIITTVGGHASYDAAFAAVAAAAAGEVIVGFLNSATSKFELYFDADGSDNAGEVLIGQFDILGADVATLSSANFAVL